MYGLNMALDEPPMPAAHISARLGNLQRIYRLQGQHVTGQAYGRREGEGHAFQEKS